MTQQATDSVSAVDSGDTLRHADPHAGSELEVSSHGLVQGVDPEEEPSVHWGWHGTFPKATIIAGWVSTAIMFVLLIGNHEGWVGPAWLVCIGLGMAAALIRTQVRRQTAWRR